MNAERVAWSPDGRTLAFTEIDDCGGRTCSGPHRVVLVGRDGRNRRTLVEGGWLNAWSPDGRFVLVEHGRPRRGLYRVSIADGSRRVVVFHGNPTSADWAPRCSVVGDGRSNRLRAGAGDDLVCALAGDDTIAGGGGSDRIFGGRGDDAIDARDGAFDVVGCGAGRDVVHADRRDRVGVDCERVVRRAR